jgi:hypothetical protein
MLTDLRIGLQVFHNGRPVELLFLSGTSADGELWYVRPLFVTEKDRFEIFKSGDALSRLHTQSAMSRCARG